MEEAKLELETAMYIATLEEQVKSQSIVITKLQSDLRLTKQISNAFQKKLTEEE